MAQITIYLPDDVARDVKLQARRAKKSVSAYIASLATEKKRGGKRWPKKFLETYGSWEGQFPRVDDPPPEPAPKW